MAVNNQVLNELPSNISIGQNKLSNVSDHVNMKDVLPRFFQHVTIPSSWTVFIPPNNVDTEPSLAPAGASPTTSPSYWLLLTCSANKLQADKRPSLWGPVGLSLHCRAVFSDPAYCWGAEGQSSLHPEDPWILLLPQSKNCVNCSNCITDYTAITFVVHAALIHLEWRAPTFICSSHTEICTWPFGQWTSTSVFLTH